MNKVLSIFAFVALLFTGACGTINPLNRPQPNLYSTAPAGHEPRSFDKPIDHVGAIFQDLAISVPANAVLKVSWDLIPENDNRKAVRKNCIVSVKDEFSGIGTQYKCRAVERSGQDFVVAFEVKPEKGPMVVKELNLSYMPGGFIEGGFYELPFDGYAGIRYGSRSSKPLRVVWSSHESVRRR